MTTLSLIGALSSDLFRVASLTHRGSKEASRIFAKESIKKSNLLLEKPLPGYLFTIISDVSGSSIEVDIKTAEKYLMYAVLLQNYTLHANENSD